MIISSKICSYLIQIQFHAQEIILYQKLYTACLAGGAGGLDGGVGEGKDGVAEEAAQAARDAQRQPLRALT